MNFMAMNKKVFDTQHPYNLGNYKYKATIRINSQFVSLYNAVDIEGRIVRIPVNMGNRVELIPNQSNQIGIWRKGRPADITYEGVPKELKIINVDHIDWIKLDVNF
jgi:hypothetical protein